MNEERKIEMRAFPLPSHDLAAVALFIDVTHVEELVSLYGTDVVYGSTLYDVEAAGRSLAMKLMALA